MIITPHFFRETLRTPMERLCSSELVLRVFEKVLVARIVAVHFHYCIQKQVRGGKQANNVQCVNF